MQEIVYLFPYAAYLLLFVLPFIFLFFSLARYRMQSLQIYAKQPSLKKLLIKRSPFLSKMKSLFLCLTWVFACLALMGPEGNLQYFFKGASEKEQLKKAKFRPHEIIFLIDSSASMSVADGSNQQTRLNQAKQITLEILDKLKGQSVALDSFTTDLYPMVPQTFDYLFFKLTLKDLKINEGDVRGGTDLFKVIDELKQNLAQSPPLKTVILITDGGDNQIEKLQGSARQAAIQQLLNIFPDPVLYSLRLFTIGVGSIEGGVVPNVTSNGQPVSVSLDEDLLKQLAIRNRGVYYAANQWSTWELAKNLIEKMDQDSPYQKDLLAQAKAATPVRSEEIAYDLYFQYPLGLALFCFFIYFLLPDVKRI